MASRTPQEQVNVRLDADLVEILEAAAFIEDASVAELARGAIEGLARRYSTDRAVRSALEARRLRSQGVASEIESKRS
jgi:hypothetical protein